MFFLLPLSHERGQVRRFPYITVGIIAINVLLYISTVIFEPGSREVFMERQERMLDFYSQHSDIDFPEDVVKRLSPDARQYIQHLEEIKKSAGDIPALDTYHFDSAEDEDKDKKLDDLHRDDLRKSEQEAFNQLVRDFDESLQNLFYKKYGYTPERGGFFTFFSSMFLHGGFFHLLFNMLFLYLCGCNIEDLWGRVLYPTFYIIGGIVATLTHTFMYPESQVPLVGASGAIAALMGAFLVRLYDTKIYFLYIFWFGFRLKRGFFYAPAYIMLPLWLLQQLWEGIIYTDPSGGGVAFWAHIGGFIFGAVIAGAFRFTGFEKKYIDPTLEKKINLLDEHLSDGVEKLREGNLDGAVLSLRKAILANPNDPIPHRELSKAYVLQKKEKVAVLEFKRTIQLYFEQERFEEAANDYIDICDEYPGMDLDIQQHIRIAETIEAQELFQEAASAYQRVADHARESTQSIDSPEAVHALKRFADISLNRLEKPQDAMNACATILKTCKNISDQDKKSLHELFKQAKQATDQQQDQKMTLKQKEVKPTESEASGVKKSDIPIQKRIKLIKTAESDPRYVVPSLAPMEANKVLPVKGGLDLKRLSEPPVLFSWIYLICAFKLKNDPERLHADIFIAGKSRPYRIHNRQINYLDFIPVSQSNYIENFRKFILFVISNIDQVYLDEGTMTFLKTRKLNLFTDQDSITNYEKSIWSQVMGDARCQCENCREIYWIDGRKVPEAGAKTRCKKCGSPMVVCKLTGSHL